MTKSSNILRLVCVMFAMAMVICCAVALANSSKIEKRTYSDSKLTHTTLCMSNCDNSSHRHVAAADTKPICIQFA